MLSISYFSSWVAKAWTAGSDETVRQFFTRQPREQLEGEIRRPHVILVVEEAVELRHPVPPPRHEGRSLGRHERREQLIFHLVVADVVIARPVQPGFLHLPDGLQDVARLEPRITLWVRQVHVPLG